MAGEINYRTYYGYKQSSKIVGLFDLKESVEHLVNHKFNGIMNVRIGHHRDRDIICYSLNFTIFEVRSI